MKTKYLYVYMLLCADGSIYTGVTNNPERRVIEHNDGMKTTSYTYSRRPVVLIYCEQFADFNLAIQRETQLKKWSRKKRLALAENRIEDLKKSSECMNETHYSNYLENIPRLLPRLSSED